MTARDDIVGIAIRLKELDDKLIRANWFAWSITADVARSKLITQADEIDRLRIGVCQLINEYPDFSERAKWAAQIFGKDWAGYMTGSAMA